MPEITEQPIAYDFLERNTDPYRDIQRISRLEPQRLRSYVEETKRKLIDVHPQLADRIESTYRFIFNVLLIEQESQATEHDKLTSAVIQHNFVHHAFYASTSASSREFATSVLRVAAATEELVRRRLEGEDQKFPVFWSGTKSELAIARALSEGGLPVYLPDYTIPLPPPSEDIRQHEVYQMDVRSGIDLFTVIPTERGNIAMLINAKGRKDASEVTVEPERGSIIDNPVSVRVLRNLNVANVRRALITVPSHLLRLAPPQTLPIDFRSEARRFCSLSSSENSAIVAQVRALVASHYEVRKVA